MTTLKWCFNRLKAMSLPEAAYRCVRVLKNKMLALYFLRMDKNAYMLRESIGKPEFFIDEKDMCFIGSHIKNRTALPPLIEINQGPCSSFGKSINRRAGFSEVEIVNVWAFNRFQWLMPYAQEYAINKEEAIAEKVKSAIQDWIDKNPVLEGLNWMDSLEISMRLLAWSYIYFLIKGSKAFDNNFEDIFLKSVYCQIRFVEENLSRYSSANNHLIGEALGLFAVGVLFPQLKGSEKRIKTGRHILEREIRKQVYSDGVSKEQSTHYHEFVTELYLIAVILGRRNKIDFSKGLNSRLKDMCGFIMHMMSDGLRPVNIGDSDDGVVLRLDMTQTSSNHVFILNTAGVLFNNPDFMSGDNNFDEKSLWLLGHEGYKRYSLMGPKGGSKSLDSRRFPESGHYIIRHKGLFLHFDCGDLGYLSLAGHGHADSLSFTLAINAREIFVDPGTYAYHSDNKWRSYFRGTSGHNTIRIDGKDQSEIQGPFLWGYKAKSYIKDWSLNGIFDKVSGYHTGYSRLKDPVIHSREITLDKSKEEIIITDSISSKGRHLIEQFFHLHPDCLLKSSGEHLFEVSNGDVPLTMETDKCLDSYIFNGSESPIAGWYSDRFREKQKTVTICNRGYSEGSKNFITKIIISNHVIARAKPEAIL